MRITSGGIFTYHLKIGCDDDCFFWAIYLTVWGKMLPVSWQGDLVWHHLQTVSAAMAWLFSLHVHRKAKSEPNSSMVTTANPNRMHQPELNPGLYCGRVLFYKYTTSTENWSFSLCCCYTHFPRGYVAKATAVPYNKEKENKMMGLWWLIVIEPYGTWHCTLDLYHGGEPVL